MQNYFQNATRKIMRTFPHADGVADLSADFCMGVFAHVDADFCIAMHNLLFFHIILQFAKFFGCEKLRLYVRTCGCGCRFMDKYVLTCRCGTPQSCARFVRAKSVKKVAHCCCAKAHCPVLETGLNLLILCSNPF